MNVWWLRLFLAVFLLLLVAEFAPKAINAFLMVVLVGMVLMQSGAIASLIGQVSQVGGKGKG